MKLLIVEDEVYLAEALCQILKKNKYAVDVSNDGEDGYYNALSGTYDVIILDIMMPKMDGISVLKAIRKEGVVTPVIMLTAKGEVSDKVLGLTTGADDYLTKPFATEELLARVQALGRRRGEIVQDDALSFGDISLDVNTLKLSRGNKSVKMTLKECELLEFLILRRGMVATKDLIIEKIWGYDSEAEDNHVEVYISFLRKKLNFLEANVVISTLRRAGYVLEEVK